MAIESASELVQTLVQQRLISSAQQAEILQLADGDPEPQAIVEEMVGRGWLSRFQADEILHGRGAELFLGPYLLLDRLSEGMHGEVYKARHQHMKRVVALQVVRQDVLADAEAVRQFYEEVQAASRLTHPNLVATYDAGPIGATHFCALEHVEGIDLDRLVREHGPLRVEQACEVVRQTAQGLQHAFERGLLHGDLKPSNLFLVRRGSVAEAGGEAGTPSAGNLLKIRNLGLTLLQPAPVADPLSGILKLAVPGDADYLAPERAAGAEPDVRSDLYSLGCIFYFLLTGRVLFPGGAAEDKLRRRQQVEPTPLDNLRPETPPAVAAIVSRLLARDPDERFQTPAEVADALAALIDPDEVGSISLPAEGTAYRAIPMPAPGAIQAPPASGLFRAEAALAPLESDSRRQRQRSEERSWYLLAGLSCLLLVGVAAGLVYLRQPPEPGKEAAKTVPSAVPPSVLEQLNPASIPAEERLSWQPDELVAVLGEHRWRPWGAPRRVVFSPDGKLVACAGDDKAIRLWDAELGHERGALYGHTGSVFALAFAPNGKMLASCGLENVVRVWDLADGKWEHRTLLGHHTHVGAVAFSPNSKLLASGSHDKTVRLWKAATGQAVEVLAGHEQPIRGLAFAPDNKTLASVSEDRTAILWDVEAKKQRAVLRGHEGSVNTLAWAAGGMLLTAGEDRTVRRWLGAEGQDLGVLFRAEHPIYSLAATRDAKMLAYCGAEGQLRLWNTAAGKELAALPGHVHAVFSVLLAPDGKRLISAGQDGTVKVWDLASGKPWTPSLGHSRPVRSVAISRDGKIAVTGGHDGAVKAWDVRSATERVPSLPNTRLPMVHAVALTPDGRMAASVGEEAGVRLWDVLTGQSRPPLTGHQAAVYAAAFSPDGSVLASGGADKTIRTWDVPRGGLQSPPWPDQPHLVSALAFSPDGKRLVSGSHDRTVKLWEVASRKELAVFTGHGRPVQAVAFSPDGQTIASAGDDSGVKLWNVATGKGQTLPSYADTGFSSVAFSPDGKTVAAAGHNGLVIRWETTTGRRLWECTLPGPVYGVVFGDDRHLLTANANGTVYVLRLPR